MTKPTLNRKYKPIFTSAARYFFLYGGRGSAKSFHISDFLLKLTYEKGHVILFTRYTMKSAEMSVIPEFKDKMNRYECTGHFHITKDAIVNTVSGSRIIFSGLKTSEGMQTAKLKSIQGVTTWVLDEAEEMPTKEEFDKIDESIRQPNVQNRVIFVLNPSYFTHWIYQSFFKDLPHEFNGEVGKDPIKKCYIYTNYLDNLTHLSKSFLGKADETKETDLLAYNHRYLGHWAKHNPSALWKRNEINIKQPGELRRIVIGVDPATTSNTKSDETGIIVAGLDAEKNCFILEDLTGKYSPEQWGKKVVSAYTMWNADLIVPEINQGGDMVKSIIRQLAPNANVKGIHASKSKKARAEPVQGLYSRGKVYHSQPFPHLEAEMLTWSGLTGDKSPNRLDAMVHAVTEIGLKHQAPKIEFS